MEEEWIKVKKILETTNLVNDKEIVDNTIENWKELLKQYNIKYKFDIEQETKYFQGVRGQYLDSVFSIYLYTLKEEAQRMKEIINDYANAKLEIPDELKNIEQETDVEIKPMKFANYFLEILLILLIILEISIMIISKDTIDNKELYIIMIIAIIGELYCIFLSNNKKRKKKNE